MLDYHLRNLNFTFKTAALKMNENWWPNTNGLEDEKHEEEVHER